MRKAFASVLDVPVSHFFEGMTSKTASGKERLGPTKIKKMVEEGGLSTKRETLELVRAYYKIKDARQRKSLAGLIAALAEK